MCTELLPTPKKSSHFLPDGNSDDGVELEDSGQVHDPALGPVPLGSCPVLRSGCHEDVGHDGQDGADGGNQGVTEFQDLAEERQDQEEANEPADPLDGQVVGEVSHVPLVPVGREKLV